MVFSIAPWLTSFGFKVAKFDEIGGLLTTEKLFRPSVAVPHDNPMDWAAILWLNFSQFHVFHGLPPSLPMLVAIEQHRKKPHQRLTGGA